MRFEKEDRFRFLNKDPRNVDWWMVERVGSNEKGLVPASYLARNSSIDAHEWFHRDATRSEAENKLRHPDLHQGTFLIRLQGTETRMVLSVRESKRRKKNVNVGHYLIKTFEKNDETFYFIYDEKDAYPSIMELIEARRRRTGDLKQKLAEGLAKTAPDLPIAPHDGADLTSHITATADIIRGRYSDVIRGNLQNPGNDSRDVMLKTVDGEDVVIKISDLMTTLRHNNVIRIHGYYSDNYIAKSLIVMDYFATTLLEVTKRKAAAGAPTDTSFFLKIASQIASGMHYLAVNGIIHGHLAARNIFVTPDGIVKVSDFGILNGECFRGNPRDDYLRWTAAEILQRGRYTIKSDVWSFGMVLYEMMSGGDQPYADLKTSTEVTRAIEQNKIQAGGLCYTYLWNHEGMLGDMSREQTSFPTT